MTKLCTALASAAFCCAVALFPQAAFGQADRPVELARSPQEVPPEAKLFAVELKTGPKWDKSKPAHEQAHFGDHSAHLKKLREQGRIQLGARYSDKGLLVLAAQTAEEVHVLISADPAIQNQLFVYEVHPFQVFYSGCIGKRPTAC